MNVADLRRFGFDKSKHVPFTKRYIVGCSRCSSCVINGHPIHERGCPNEMHECAGCCNVIPARQKYCEDCS